MKTICIGSSSKDIFFPTKEGVILNTPENIESQQKLSFELGAKYQVNKIIEAPGGCAANVSQGLARLGIKVDCYTKIGKDSVGKWIESELKKEGVGTELIQIDETCHSDVSAIIVDENSKDHIIFFNRDANKNLNIEIEKLEDAEMIFVSALNGDWEKHFDKILSVIKNKKIKLAFNPGQRNIKDNPQKIIKMISQSDVLILNKDEAIESIKRGTPDNIDNNELNSEEFLIKKLLEIGARVVAITDGIRGAWVGSKSQQEILYSQAEGKNATDTLGAGDAFSSGFLAGQIIGESLEVSLHQGTQNSASVVNFYGAKKGLLRSKINKIK